MRLEARARQVLSDTGRTQTWVAQKMNQIDPELEMSVSKLSATLTGRRTMTGEEFLAFCRATQTNPSDFLADVSA